MWVRVALLHPLFVACLHNFLCILLAVNVSFTNFLLMEHLLHNPALLVFVDLMRSITTTPGDDEESLVTSSKPCEYGTLASARNGKG